ncbi:S1/P1 nuclease [Penicillium samsonianum]|uniref:S1/P1 nuclease n=1 Tax=Penicillium samsonianum TaxID=1882272 RepID=UPI0025485BFA|nr:S1/P1 nuclease [Penicillium samsonianum]KAJ6133220.1 S1/P1 nuclease [Penicillium samsonianum]
MFLFHFFGDLYMPLYVEGYEKGGNGVDVAFKGHKDNLHNMPYKINAIRYRLKYNDKKLNKYRPTSAVECVDVTNPHTYIMQWAEETNLLNRAVVFKRGIPYLTSEDLGGEYYDDAVPVIAEQIVKAGVRLAAWINALAEQRRAKTGDPMRELWGWS